MKKLLIMIILATAMVGLSAIGSIAGVKKISHDQLKQAHVNGDLDARQDMNYTSSDTTNICWFWASVKLPVGKKITKLVYYHSGQNSCYTSVKLQRFKLGEPFDMVAHAESDDFSQQIIAVEDTSIDYPRIKSGYTYMVYVQSYNSDSRIHGIKIIYQE